MTRRWRNAGCAGLAVVLGLTLAAGCGETNTNTGSGGSGGTTQTSGGGGQGGVDCDAPDEPPMVSDDWCERLPAGPAGSGPTPVDLSAAHALVRFFGPVTDHVQPDQALAAALASDDAWSGRDLSAYASALPGIACARPATTGMLSLGPAAVTSSGDVALVKPGTGPVELPPDTRAVLVDLRDLPWTADLREALLAAVSPALATPVPGLVSKVRAHDGMVDEIFSVTNVYKSFTTTLASPEIPATGAEDLPLALLTGPELPPDAVEIAATLRLANRAWIIGEDLRVEVAEARWQGVGDSGVAVRWRDLFREDKGPRLPDALPADRRTGKPQCFAADILAQGPVPDAAIGIDGRPKIAKTQPFGDAQPVGDALGDARAALVVSHGAVRRFYPYFETVGDVIDERLVETVSALPASPSREDTYQALRRFGEALHDGHNFITDRETPAAGVLAVHIEPVDGLPVIRRSAAPGIEPGDTIVSIDGVPAEEWIATELARSGGATPGYKFSFVMRQLTIMSGPVELGLEDAAGNPKTVGAEPQPLEDIAAIDVASSRPAGFLDDLGAPGLYYINLDRTVLQDVSAFNAALTEATSAAGLVLDMRGYPGVNHYAVAQRLLQKDFTSPIFSVPQLTGPDQRHVDETSTPLSPLAGPPSYSGPIALLVGHVTVSAAENFAIMLVDQDRVTVVGRQSAGTNGNITGVQLPGHFTFGFTGMEVRHADPDKSLFHGVGILPDIEVPLSAADFAAGTDPELEAAITWLLAQ